MKNHFCTLLLSLGLAACTSVTHSDQPLATSPLAQRFLQKFTPISPNAGGLYEWEEASPESDTSILDTAFLALFPKPDTNTTEHIPLHSLLSSGSLRAQYQFQQGEYTMLTAIYIAELGDYSESGTYLLVWNKATQSITDWLPVGRNGGGAYEEEAFSDSSEDITTFQIGYFIDSNRKPSHDTLRIRQMAVSRFTHTENEQATVNCDSTVTQWVWEDHFTEEWKKQLPCDTK
ncbi:hypothetical protein [Xanthocytophaga agilis]|uniref:Lipoprotein n=1 Tax=Xanthocytophaga agilis TaxID=3048010 RepID=A0AAE3R7W0_9BACT|nr:hypothetical protein [Xanthocytophaga agilis]MDJ1504845.1 hypothetical protein [Xanthocytophaga agilis]